QPDAERLAQPGLERAHPRRHPLHVVAARAFVAQAEDLAEAAAGAAVRIDDHPVGIEEGVLEQYLPALLRRDVVLEDARLVLALVALDEGDVRVVAEADDLGLVAVLDVRAEVLLPRAGLRVAELGRDVGAGAVGPGLKACTQFAG